MKAHGQTAALVEWVDGLRFEALDAATRHAAIRHAIDTIGVIAAGAGSALTGRVVSLLPETGGPVAVPGLSRGFPLLDSVYVGGCAGHGLELDDGYRLGSVHPGVAVVPAAIALAQAGPVDGAAFLRALVCGYQAVASVARACHPRLRQRGFHPTGAVGVLGSAVASSCLLGLDPAAMTNALGLSASAAAGLFAFVGGGADVKRLHAAHAAREGVWAALLARQGVEGPPAVLEAADGFMIAFAGADEPAIALPSAPGDFGIADCYIKPHPCCRHLQPALEAMLELVEAHSLAVDDIEKVEVETYAIAASHAGTPWDSMASAQLSFPYILMLGLRFGGVELRHFDKEVLVDPAFEHLAARIDIRASAEMDDLYPAQRPARVVVHSRKGRHEAFRGEALGSREWPLSDEGVSEKFLRLVVPVCGERAARDVLGRLWDIESVHDVGAVLRRLSEPAIRP